MISKIKKLGLCTLFLVGNYTRKYGTNDLQEIGFDFGVGYFQWFMRYWFIWIFALIIILLVGVWKRLLNKLNEF